MNWDEMTAAERLAARPEIGTECFACRGLDGVHASWCGDEDEDYDDEDDLDFEEDEE